MPGQIHDMQIDIIYFCKKPMKNPRKNVLKYNARWLRKSCHCFIDSKFSRGVAILFLKINRCKIN